LSIERFVYLPLRKRRAPNLVLLTASFGIFIFVQNLIQLLYGAETYSLRSGAVSAGYNLLGGLITRRQIFIICTSWVLVLLLWLFIDKTRAGKAIRAVSDEPIAASIVGINPERVVLMSFGIGSVLAAIAGILISLETNLDPTMGFNAIMKGIIASIIGGFGSLPGAMFGGLFIGLAENLGIYKIQAGWKDCISFLVLIGFLLFRPQGLRGIMQTRKD
jgi:branched-chain amino acid transport system permease protein